MSRNILRSIKNTPASYTSTSREQLTPPRKAKERIGIELSPGKATMAEHIAEIKYDYGNQLQAISMATKILEHLKELGTGYLDREILMNSILTILKFDRDQDNKSRTEMPDTIVIKEEPKPPKVPEASQEEQRQAALRESRSPYYDMDGDNMVRHLSSKPKGKTRAQS